MSRYLTMNIDNTLTLSGSWERGYNADYHVGRCYLSSDGKFDVNLSSEFTILIQNAGRWCEHYASDILIDIDAVKHLIDNWLDETSKELEFKFLFGFRQSGVDSESFITARWDNRFNEYRAIYAWEIRFNHEDLGWTMNWEFGRVQ